MLFAAHGYIVTGLVPYMYHLNPTVLARHQIKNYVRSHNSTEDMLLTILGRTCAKTDDRHDKEE